MFFINRDNDRSNSNIIIVVFRVNFYYKFVAGSYSVKFIYFNNILVYLWRRL